MTKKPPRRQRPTFAEIADRVRQEAMQDYEARLAIEKQDIFEAARQEYEHAYNLLSKHTTALEQENAQLRERLLAAESSWLKALGSWIRRLWS
jgi:hypothetical protein